MKFKNDFIHTQSAPYSEEFKPALTIFLDFSNNNKNNNCIFVEHS